MGRNLVTLRSESSAVKDNTSGGIRSWGNLYISNRRQCLCSPLSMSDSSLPSSRSILPTYRWRAICLLRVRVWVAPLGGWCLWYGYYGTLRLVLVLLRPTQGGESSEINTDRGSNLLKSSLRGDNLLMFTFTNTLGYCWQQ